MLSRPARGEGYPAGFSQSLPAPAPDPRNDKGKGSPAKKKAAMGIHLYAACGLIAAAEFPRSPI